MSASSTTFHDLQLIDALEGLRGLQDNSVDLVVTDPPYDSLEKWRDMGTTTRLKNSSQSSNSWFPTVSNDYLQECFEQCFRVLKKNTHLYIMCDEETGDGLKPRLQEIGFHLRKSLIWHKVGKLKPVNCPQCGFHVMDHHSKGTPGMGYPYRSQWEMVLLAEKGKRKPPKDRSVRNVLSVPWIKSRKAYPTEKPVELLSTFIRQSSQEGELVLDPFAGSGSCGEAAFKLGRNFLGFDVSQDSLDYFARRKQKWVTPDEDSEDLSDGTKTNGILDLFGDR